MTAAEDPHAGCERYADKLADEVYKAIEERNRTVAERDELRQALTDLSRHITAANLSTCQGPDCTRCHLGGPCAVERARVLLVEAP